MPGVSDVAKGEQAGALLSSGALRLLNLQGSTDEAKPALPHLQDPHG